MTTATRVKRLWISVDGRCYCDEHGGYYLAQEIAAKPRADQHFAGSDHWMAFRTDEGLSCEECGATVSPVLVP